MIDIIINIVLIVTGIMAIEWLSKKVNLKKGWLHYKWPSPHIIKKSNAKENIENPFIVECSVCHFKYEYKNIICPQCGAGIIWEDGEYCIACNIKDTRKKYLRQNSKAWIVNGWSGGGYERVQIVCRTKGGRLVQKWIALKFLTNFRACWIPPFLKSWGVYSTGTKENMKLEAERFNNRFYLKEV